MLIKIIIILLIIEAAIILGGIYLYQNNVSTSKILDRGPNESSVHFWIFYHMKIYAIIITLGLAIAIFGRKSKIVKFIRIIT